MQAQMSQISDLPPPRYQFFILGLYLQAGSRPTEQVTWRISLEDPRTAQRSGFTTLADLEAFLAAWMDERMSGER